MTFKIEKVTVPRAKKADGSATWESFLEAVQKLKVGESFIIEKPMSHHRLSLSIAKVWLNGNYSMLRCEGGYRVYKNK